jgi:hypothetical protein
MSKSIPFNLRNSAIKKATVPKPQQSQSMFLFLIITSPLYHILRKIARAFSILWSGRGASRPSAWLFRSIFSISGVAVSPSLMRGGPLRSPRQWRKGKKNEIVRAKKKGKKIGGEITKTALSVFGSAVMAALSAVTPIRKQKSRTSGGFFA